MRFQTTTLDNGLEIIAEINEAARSTALGFFVRTGSRDETDEIAGVSHFLEHMVFKGSERRDAETVNRELDELGGVSNAFTSEETTAYYAKTLPELTDRAVELFGDMLRPALRTEDFETEKNVILEEIKMYEDQPPFGVDEKCRELFFAGHPLSRSVLGSRESVSALTADQMRDYFERRYSPSNVVFAATGQIDFDRLVKQVDAACGAWKPFETSRESWRPTGKRETCVVKRESAAQEYVLQLVDAPAAGDADRYAAAILAVVLGDDVGSRLFWELVDSGRADSATTSFADFSDAGFFCASLCCRPEDVVENVATIREILAEARAEGIGEEELERAKNKLRTRIALSAERPQSRLFSVGSEWLTTRRYRSVADDLKIVRETTLDEIAATMEKYPFDNPFAIAVGPADAIE